MVAAGLVRYAGRDVMGGYVEPPDDLKIDNFSLGSPNFGRSGFCFIDAEYNLILTRFGCEDCSRLIRSL